MINLRLPFTEPTGAPTVVAPSAFWMRVKSPIIGWILTKTMKVRSLSSLRIEATAVFPPSCLPMVRFWWNRPMPSCPKDFPRIIRCRYMKDFLSLCFTKPVIKRATYTALIVGTILIAINHGDALLRGQVDATRLFKIILTVFVPYIVSTTSSVSAMLNIKNGRS